MGWWRKQSQMIFFSNSVGWKGSNISNSDKEVGTRSGIEPWPWYIQDKLLRSNCQEYNEGRQLKKFKKNKKFKVCLFFCSCLLQFQVGKQGICLSISDHKITMFSLINLRKGEKDRMNSFVTKVLLLLPLNQQHHYTCPVYPALHISTLFVQLGRILLIFTFSCFGSARHTPCSSIRISF